jgi:hypothetical protein
MRAAILHCRTQTMRALQENIAGFSGCRSSALAIRSYSLIAVISLFFFSPVNLNAQPSADSPQAFIDVSVVGMDSPRVLGHQTVLIEHGRIVNVGPSHTVRLPAKATRIEGHNHLLLPGLADMHVHLMEPEAYFPLFLAYGVTTVRNMAGGPAGDARMPVAGHVPPHVGLQRALVAHQWSIEHLTGYFEWLQNDGSPFKKEEEHEVFSHPAHLLARGRRSRTGLMNRAFPMPQP